MDEVKTKDIYLIIEEVLQEVLTVITNSVFNIKKLTSTMNTEKDFNGIASYLVWTLKKEFNGIASYLVFCRFTRAEFAELDSVIDRKLRLKSIAKIKR